MDKLIAGWEGKRFSGEEIVKLCDGKVLIRRVRDLAGARSLKEAMGKHKAMVILYETKDSSGHWCAVFEAAPGLLEFFDPYGIRPDGELEFIDRRFMEESGQGPHLSRLIEKSKYPVVEYNSTPLQKFSRDMNTCGRWCGLRICFRDIPLKNFIRLFRRQKFPADWYVTALTMFV